MLVEGVEPPILSAAASKTAVYPSSTTLAISPLYRTPPKMQRNLVDTRGLEPRERRPAALPI